MNTVARIEARLAENKGSIKTYKTYEAAEKVGYNLAQDYANFQGVISNEPEFIVVFLPKSGRFTVVFQLMSYLQRNQLGGYVGWFAQSGFFSI